MKIKRALLFVEPQKTAMKRAFRTLSNPTRKYAGVTLVSFPDFETLGKVITGTRIQLLNAIRVKKPKSIQELARMVGRNIKNVHQDVSLLAEFGLIEFCKPGHRRSVAMVAKFQELILAA